MPFQSQFFESLSVQRLSEFRSNASAIGIRSGRALVETVVRVQEVGEDAFETDFVAK